MATTTYPTISPVDALWTLYQAQTKKVKKDFLKRVTEENAAIKEAEKMRDYEQSLTEEQRMTAHTFVNEIKKRVDDVEKAYKEGLHVGRKASDFLQELQSERV
jgi:regulator of replication initiation timing